MIKSLRRKFIAITMCSVVVVLGIIMAIINITNYYDINKHADELLNVLVENKGEFPKPDDKIHSKKTLFQNMSPEAPFETRYFSVVLRDNQEVVSVNTGRIAAISTETAAKYAIELQSTGKASGFLNNYKYRVVSIDDTEMYVFLDCTREFSTFYSFLLTSCLVAIFGILSVFVLVVFFSKIVIKPVAESYEKQKRFITDASHEIKTPLTIIGASTEVLELETGENEWTRSIKNQIKRLSSLTEKLVFLSRMDEESTKLQMTDFSLSDAVLETAQPFEAVATAQGKTLCFEIEKQVSYYGEKDLIKQLISLLLDNSLKYSDENGQIFLNLKTVGKSVEISVANMTSQIEKDKLDVLFERFYRPDASRNSQTGGHGIGLSVAKSIVNVHKGKISVRSEDGKSIVFTVIL